MNPERILVANFDTFWNCFRQFHSILITIICLRMICNKILKPNYGALENCCSVELQQSVCDENRDDEWFKKNSNDFEGRDPWPKTDWSGTEKTEKFSCEPDRG